MTAACCCPCVANCAVALRLATAIGGSFIRLCGPEFVVFQFSGVIVGVAGVPGTGTVDPLVGGNSGDATNGYPPLPKRDGSAEENAEIN